MHYVFRTTTEKLGAHLDHIAESGDAVLHIQFKGGRDWDLICRKASERPVLVAEVSRG